MPASINPFDRLDFGGYGNGGQCFTGVCSQDRVDIAAVPAAFPAAQMAVESTTRYVALSITDGARVKIYAGPVDATDAVKQARATVAGDGWSCAVQAGHVVHVWAA